MAKRRKRKRITPLGYIVLSIIILVMLVGIYFIIWSMRGSGGEQPSANMVSNAVQITPTPSLPPVASADTATQAPTELPTQTPEVTPSPTVKPDDTPMPDAKTPSPSQVQTAVDGKTGSKLNLRKGPGTNYDVVGTYAIGTRLKIYALEGEFYFVMVMKENKYGYMAAEFVEKNGLLPGESATPVPDAPDGKVNGTVTSTVALRTIPSTENNNPVGQLEPGTAVYILFRTGKFYYIEIVASKQKYYGYSQYIRAEGDVPEGTPVP